MLGSSQRTGLRLPWIQESRNTELLQSLVLCHPGLHCREQFGLESLHSLVFASDILETLSQSADHRNHLGDTGRGMGQLLCSIIEIL